MMNQRRTRKIPPNSKVRRRLFPEDNTDEARSRLDNFTNILKESLAREREEKSKKWSFDIVNDVPLKGNYKWWYDAEKDKWIGMKVEVEANETENLPVTELLAFPKSLVKNENTPVHVRDEAAPLIRKRKRVIDNKVVNQDVKRKIDFDQ